MRTIRAGVFETNSSSTHSLVISGHGDIDTQYTINGDGLLEIHPYRFGWEWEEYTAAWIKLTYIYLYIKDWVMGNRGYRTPDPDSPYMKLLEDVCKEQTGCVGLIEIPDDDDGFYPLGYIDHQSVEDRDLDYLFENDGQSLRDFIFNKNSILKTGNDNEDGPW